MASWPGTIPDDLLVDGYTESPPDLLIRTKMDQGPDKIRRWGTGGTRPISGQMIMSTTEIDDLETFYVTTLEGGALRFDWTAPRTGSAVEFRFVRPPKYSAIGGIKWMVQLKLEIMP